MATIIGTPSFFDLGETTTPGAQTLTVPSDATHVAIFFVLSDSADTPDATVSSLSSTFAGTFTINNSVSTPTSASGAICVAAVTSTGASKTFTPVLSSTSIVAGAIACVVFLKEVGATWPTAVGFGHATGDGTTAATASASGLNGGLAIALDTRLSTTATLPANESGWTAVTTGQRGPGTYGYYCLCRLRSLALTSTATVNATTQDTFASVISLLTIKAGEQALTPGLVTNTQTFYAPTVGRGAVTLAPTLFTNSQTFYAPSVGRGTVTLAPALVTNSQTFPAPTVSASYGLTPGLLTNTQTFYGPSVAVGAVTLAPSLLANTQTFYAPSVTTGAGPQELLPSLVMNGQIFYAAAVSSSYALTPELLTNEQTFPAATVSTRNTLTPSLLTNSQTFYSPAVSVGAVTLQPSLVTNGQTFYAPTVLQQSNVELLPGLLTNEQTFFSPTVAFAQLAATGGWEELRRTRADRDAERRRLGILPPEPTPQQVPVTPAEIVALRQPDRAAASRTARTILERFAPIVVQPVEAVALPPADAEPTMAPIELAPEIQALLAATQKQRAFEQDLVYIVATLLS